MVQVRTIWHGRATPTVCPSSPSATSSGCTSIGTSTTTRGDFIFNDRDSQVSEALEDRSLPLSEEGNSLLL